VSKLSVQPRIPAQLTSRSDIRSTDIQTDVRADIGATDIGVRFTTDIRGSTDNSTQTSVILRIFKRISARTVRPGVDKYLDMHLLQNVCTKSYGSIILVDEIID